MSKEEDKEAKEKVRHYLVNVLVGHQTGINKLYQPIQSNFNSCLQQHPELKVSLLASNVQIDRMSRRR